MNTVHRVSRERPATPIYGITNNEHTYHWLALSWGTESFLLDEDYHDKSRKDLMIFTDKILKDAGKVTDGDKIVVLSSARASTSRAAPIPSTSTPLELATEVRFGQWLTD